MNWGWKITVVYILFATGMIGLVLLASSQRVDLVSQDYYRQELNYSQQLQAVRNAAEWNDSVQVIAQQGKLQIRLPQSIQSGSAMQLYWYCPFNAVYDRRQSFAADTSQWMMWDVSDTPPGRYELRISWEMDGHPYFSQHQVIH
jgi:hypothetical protein